MNVALIVLSILLLLVIAYIAYPSLEGFVEMSRDSSTVVAPAVPVPLPTPAVPVQPAPSTPDSVLVSAPAPANRVSPTQPAKVSVSDTGYDAMSLKQQSDLLAKIKQMVRQELLSSRQLDATSCEGDSSDSSTASTASATSPASSCLSQGRDYLSGVESEKQMAGRCDRTPASSSCHSSSSSSPALNPSEYVRKDSIPCWGCSM